ncbi:MAG: hypothetical protein GY856_39410 [bacterium]|nr:hypothetical protein [bacterium]
MTVDMRRVAAVFLVLVCANAQAEKDPGRPTRLAIEPNAILRDDQPLEIRIEGIPKDVRARIWVVRDCDQDDRPDDDPECPRVYDCESEPADGNGLAVHRLDFTEIEKSKPIFPRGEMLWLRAAHPDSQRFRQAMFGFVKDECSLFKTASDVFLRGPCKPGLKQVLRRHRQPSGLANAVFEVRRLVVDDPAAEPLPVPGTRGSSGVAWLDGETLLVTAAGVADEGSLAAGLYLVPLKPNAQPERLWSPGDGGPGAVAPLALGHGRAAFVRQAPGPQRIGAESEVAWLTVLRIKGREIEHRVPLPYKVHQLVAASSKGKAVLALSLGVADNQPMFFVVNLAEEGSEPEVLGFSTALYQSLMREPGGERSVVAFENAFAGQGWQLVVAEGTRLTRDLVKREGRHDLAPAWRPQGGELAYLAQVGAVR